LRDGELIYSYVDGSEWGISKVLWLSSPDYRGPALIRGYQLDGTNELRFMRGADPPSELQFPVEGSDSSPELEPGWRQLGSETRVRAPGCYAYQVDGLDFTEVIVFQFADDLVWETLRQRPLDLPWQAPGEPCPTASGREVSPAYAPGLGEGPIYPVGLSTDGVLHYGYTGEFEGSEWGGSKVLWVSSADYQGPALIRGYQIDGTNEVRFDRGSPPPAELQFPIGGSASSPDQEPGWREVPSYTRVRAAGCYAYQVDGLDFTEVIVFRAQAEAPSP